MIRLVLSAAVVSFGFQASAAGAKEAPWCAVIETSKESVYWDCQYRSIEECRPHILAGNRGWCNPSPYYVAPSERRRPVKRHRAQ
ncbi:MAG TPA: DUF3551 domain-containing protein [Pseudolabrys sp.]|nr:DUF3551 domain-containing protein [Pseudolabrys sp.]